MFCDLDGHYREKSFDIFSPLDIRKRNKRSHSKRKNKHALTLLELSIALNHSGRHMALLRLVTLSISSLRLINSMIELIDFMMQHFLPGVSLNMIFGHI